MPAVRVVTLGAGDVLHGTLAHRLAAHGYLSSQGFVEALRGGGSGLTGLCLVRNPGVGVGRVIRER